MASSDLAEFRFRQHDSNDQTGKNAEEEEEKEKKKNQDRANDVQSFGNLA